MRPVRAYRPDDRVQRVRGHPLADYRPTGVRGTVVSVFDKPYLIRVRWDDEHEHHRPFPHLSSTAYHPDVLEPLSAVDRLAELGGGPRDRG